MTAAVDVLSRCACESCQRRRFSTRLAVLASGEQLHLCLACREALGAAPVAPECSSGPSVVDVAVARVGRSVLAASRAATGSERRRGDDVSTCEHRWVRREAYRETNGRVWWTLVCARCAATWPVSESASEEDLPNDRSRTRREALVLSIATDVSSAAATRHARVVHHHAFTTAGVPFGRVRNRNALLRAANSERSEQRDHQHQREFAHAWNETPRGELRQRRNVRSA